MALFKLEFSPSNPYADSDFMLGAHSFSYSKVSRYRLARLSPYWVLAICLLSALGAFFGLKWSLHKDGERRFDMVTRQIEGRIRTRLERYENALVQTRAYFLASGDVDRESFRRYVDHLALLEKYPGIQGLGYVTRIKPADLRQHIREVQATGHPTYRVWPDEAPRDEYYSTLYIEPFDWRNQRAFGYDMFTDPIRREAMARARDTGFPATSGLLTLVQETPEEITDVPQPGFIMYVPVYRGGVVPATLEERREALEGFVFSPFRAHKLFQAIFQRSIDEMDVDLEVFDGDLLSTRTLLFDVDQVHRFGEERSQRIYQALRRIDLPGRSWTLVVRSLDNFSGPLSRSMPWGALLLGTLVGLLFFHIVRGAQEHSQDQAETRRTLELINQVGRKISGELELERLVQAVIDVATQLTRARFGAFSYTGTNSDGEPINLCAVSGTLPEKLTGAPASVGFYRSDDLRREGSSAEGLPFADGADGMAPAVSYLAVPVVSRSGESVGGLYFTHSEAGAFTEREEQIVVGLAAQAAVAIDNARLFKKAQGAIAARDEFLSICSHELKTPLTSLKLQTQMYRRKLQSRDPASMAPERMEKLTETSERQIERLTRLVEDMLDIARISTGRMAMRPEPVDVYSMVADVIERISPQAVAALCTISLRGPSTSIVAHWDRIRVEQVVANLLSNAIKYGARMPIDVVVSQEGDNALIRVRDYGIGIDKSHHSKIFERFERAVSASNISGLGLGLYIVRQIVEAHDGKIEVVSEAGQGSTFTVRLPLRPAMIRPGLATEVTKEVTILQRGQGPSA